MVVGPTSNIAILPISYLQTGTPLMYISASNYSKSEVLVYISNFSVALTSVITDIVGGCLLYTSRCV